MGLLQDWGNKASNEGKKAWKSGKHWVEQTFGDAGDFIDRKTPEFRINVDAKIDHKVQIDKDNFNVRMDSKDFAKSLSTIGSGIESGLGNVATSIGGALTSFGENLSRGLEKLGQDLGDSVELGLSQLGNELNSAAVQIAAGISSHGTSIESASADLAQSLNGAVLEASHNFQNGLALLGSSIEKFDATGGIGRYLLSNVQYAQAAGQKLLALDQYFSRVGGENILDTYLLKVANASSRPLPNLTFLTRVTLRGIGGTEYQTIRISGAPTSGSFTLTFLGAASAPIPWNATPDRVRTALESLATVGVGNVICDGPRFPSGSIDVIFVHALAGIQPLIIATSANLQMSVVKTDWIAQEEKGVIVSGDPVEGADLFAPGSGGLVTLGRFRREFGVPYVASVVIELLGSEQRDAAKQAAVVLANQDFPTSARVRAADQLGAFGAFAWDELTGVRSVRDDMTAPTAVREAASDAVRRIESQHIDAVASVLLATGELVEPVSMLRGQLTAPIVLVAAAAPSPNRLPLTVDRSRPFLITGTLRGIRVKAVNDCDIAPSELVPRIRRSFGEVASPVSSAVAIPNLQDAIDTARELGILLREMIPPNPFHYDARDHSLYDLVREVLAPTFELLRVALTTLEQLKPHFEHRFRVYAERAIDDPALTHLLGVQIIDGHQENATVTVHIEVHDIASGNFDQQDLVFAIRPSSGEAVLPIPLRFVDTLRKRVLIQVAAETDPSGVPLRVLASHYSGMIGNFAVQDQTTSGEIKFLIERMVDIDLP
jgi:hypothetical protein